MRTGWQEAMDLERVTAKLRRVEQAPGVLLNVEGDQVLQQGPEWRVRGTDEQTKAISPIAQRGH